MRGSGRKSWPAAVADGDVDGERDGDGGGDADSEGDRDSVGATDGAIDGDGESDDEKALKQYAGIDAMSENDAAQLAFTNVFPTSSMFDKLGWVAGVNRAGCRCCCC